MKIQVLSDLHNEFIRGKKLGIPDVEAYRAWHALNRKASDSSHAPKAIPAEFMIAQTDADVIILAGDIDIGSKGVDWANIEAQALGKPIVYVAGNHEYYQGEYHKVKAALEQAASTNVRVLNPGEWIWQGVRFLGCTLWTDYCADAETPQPLAREYAQSHINDHKRIRFKKAGRYGRFSPTDALWLHLKELSWLQARLAEPFSGKTVVITHHGPHPLCQHPDYAVSPVSAAYWSNLEDLITNADIDLWIFGHSHHCLDAQVQGTRLIANQRGYMGMQEVAEFNPGYVVSVE
ncbi:MAG: metallophosphoesterase [gamma proteobacterium symbiont of Bathyaustriella thionipta]|nr:metallophosphoesterase [gamma proteobacterium symbiont of Bathyaustriella thionipta]